MKKTLKEMEAVIREIKEYEDLKKSLSAEIDRLKAECIDFMEQEDTDEIITDEGKVTYREVLAKRFNSTQFKKDYLALYEQYTKMTSNMRFTCN